MADWNDVPRDIKEMIMKNQTPTSFSRFAMVDRDTVEIAREIRDEILTPELKKYFNIWKNPLGISMKLLTPDDELREKVCCQLIEKDVSFEDLEFVLMTLEKSYDNVQYFLLYLCYDLGLYHAAIKDFYDYFDLPKLYAPNDKNFIKEDLPDMSSESIDDHVSHNFTIVTAIEMYAIILSIIQFDPCRHRMSDLYNYYRNLRRRYSNDKNLVKYNFFIARLLNI